MHFNQDDINTGERLRGIRESMKMNREEFSEKIDITNRKRRKSFKCKNLKKSCKIYRCLC